MKRLLLALLVCGTAIAAALTPPPASAARGLSIEKGMTARECAEVFGCCVCRQRIPGQGCIDWQGC